MSIWRFLLEHELASWARAGQTLYLWWRDDDARKLTPQLDRLLTLSEQYSVPLTLAVIPSTADNSDLVSRIRDLRNLNVIQHGIDHVNRARATEHSPREMASLWTIEEIVAHLNRTKEFQRLPHVIPVFAPPWNALHPCLEPALRMTGFKARSAYSGSIHRSEGLLRIDAHLDILRWRGGARFRGEGRFLRRLIRLGRERRRAAQWSEPIGLLTHHLQHDEASWQFLERFIQWTKADPAVKWQSLPELMARFG